MNEDRERRRARNLRDLLVALALAATVVPGVLASTVGGRGYDPLVVLVWLGVIAPSIGACSAGLGLRGWPEGAAVVGVWSSVVATLGGISERILPTPLWAAAALAGLYFFGFGLARIVARPTSVACALLAVTMAATWLPGAPGALSLPWPSAWAACALDFSPATLLAECAGVDWMRVDGVYAHVGTDRFSRTAWSPELAGPISLLLGCSAWGIAAFLTGRRRSDHDPELDPWR